MRTVRVARFALTALGIGGATYLYFALLHPIRPAAEHPFFDGARTLAIAHQGGRGLWPENTLTAFEGAAALGVDVLEMDLRGTKDGHLVVLHDPTVERTTDGRGPVAELDLDEIRALDAGYRFRNAEGEYPYRGRGIRIPTLEEVLSRFPDIRVNLEMKDFEPPLARTLCSELRRLGAATRSLVASFEHAPMVAFREICAEVATSATMREGLLFYQLDRLKLLSVFRSPAVAFEVPEYLGDIHVVRPPFLERARSFNLRVQVWTVNEEEDLKRLLSMGVDGIVTDYPDRLLRAMGRL
jgi:glycerophosphoryl diester phosphodiesterase